MYYDIRKILAASVSIDLCGLRTEWVKEHFSMKKKLWINDSLDCPFDTIYTIERILLGIWVLLKVWFVEG